MSFFLFWATITPYFGLFFLDFCFVGCFKFFLNSHLYLYSFRGYIYFEGNEAGHIKIDTELYLKKVMISVH